MGGAYRVPGNTAPTTEWNIHCDPEAAEAQLRCVVGGRRLACRARLRSGST